MLSFDRLSVQQSRQWMTTQHVCRPESPLLKSDESSDALVCKLWLLLLIIKMMTIYVKAFLRGGPTYQNDL